MYCLTLCFLAIVVSLYFGFYKTACRVFVFDMFYTLLSASKSHKPKTPEELLAEMKAGEEALEAFKASWKRNILHVLFLLAGLAFAAYVLYLYLLSKDVNPFDIPSKGLLFYLKTFVYCSDCFASLGVFILCSSAGFSEFTGTGVWDSGFSILEAVPCSARNFQKYFMLST